MLNRILIVEDDHAISEAVALNMQFVGYGYAVFDDGKKAADSLADDHAFDLALLDIMLPGIDGFELFSYMEKYNIPVIYMTAKTDSASEIKGLMDGAEDYIVKPFAPAELVARVESVLRRAGRSMVVYHLWDLTVDTAACRIQRGDEEIRLTPKEYELLLLFLRNRGRALYRDYLYETVWGDDGTGCDTRTLDTHIARLRRKLNLGDRLHSVRQIGYMLEKE